MAFDIEGAKKAGYSDAEIADHLGPTAGFDVAGARKAGYSDQEIIGHLSKAVGVPEPAPKIDPADVPSVPQTLMIGAGKTFDRVLDGLTQVYLGAKGDDKALGGLKTNVDEKNRTYKPLQEARPFATALGESLPAMTVPVAGAGGSAVATTARVGLSGAAIPALEYGSAGERAKAAGLGATGAVIGGVVAPKVLNATATGMGVAGNTIKNLVAGRVSPEREALAIRAAQLGIPVSAGALTTSTPARVFASVVDTMPFSGAHATREAQQEAFNRAVSRTFGEDAPRITSDVYATARNRIGAEFERLSAQNNLNVTPTLMREVNDVIDRSARLAKNDTGRTILNLATDLRSKMDPATMTVPGQVYQSIDSEISALSKGATGDVAHYLQQLQTALRRGMDASIAPADQEAWRLARTQYKNLKAVRDLVAKDGADGNISPKLLMGRLNATNAGKESMAQGTRGELQDIAQVGKEFVAGSIPNSGTAQRAMALAALGGGGYMAGVDGTTLAQLMLAGATGGRAVNNTLNRPITSTMGITNPRHGGPIVGGSIPAGTALANLLARDPSFAARVGGSGAGMTLADMYNRE